MSWLGGNAQTEVVHIREVSDITTVTAAAAYYGEILFDQTTQRYYTPSYDGTTWRWTTLHVAVYETSKANLDTNYPPSSAFRFWRALVPGGAGEEDIEYICLKKQSDSYAWIPSAVGGP